MVVILLVVSYKSNTDYKVVIYKNERIETYRRAVTEISKERWMKAC